MGNSEDIKSDTSSLLGPLPFGRLFSPTNRMLAAAPFSSLLLSSTTTPICRPHAIAVLPVVSAKIPISRRNDDHVPQDQQMGGLGFSALSTLKSSSSSSSSSSKSYTPRKNNDNNNKSSRSIEEKGPSSSPLSGSDVLLALQRAAADKARSKKGKKGKPRMGGVEQRPSPTAIADYSDVRPLNIRSDWGDRLDEMERLLQELQMEDEAHRY